MHFERRKIASGNICDAVLLEREDQIDRERYKREQLGVKMKETGYTRNTIWRAAQDRGQCRDIVATLCIDIRKVNNVPSVYYVIHLKSK